MDVITYPCLMSSANLLSKSGPWTWLINTLRPKQNGPHFADDTFKCIFLNEYVKISIGNSRKFVPKCPMNNIPVLVQIMAWHRPGDKPLSESMMVSLLMYICVTRPQWVNVCVHQYGEMADIQPVWITHMWSSMHIYRYGPKLDAEVLIQIKHAKLKLYRGE